MSSSNLANGGGIGQVASDLLKDMNKAQEDAKASDGKNRPAGGGAAQDKSFDKVLQSQQENQTQSIHTSKASQKTVEAVQVQKAATETVVNKTQKEQQLRHNKWLSTQVGGSDRRQPSKMMNMLQDLIHGQDKMTEIMNLALSGRQFSPTDLIAMQAGVYRFSQELDLTSKVVEKATSAIKQTLNTQV